MCGTPHHPMHQLSLSPASTRSVCPCVPVGARVFPCVPVCVPRRAPSAHAVRLCDSRARRATALARCATARPSPPPLAARPWPPSRTRLSSLSGPKTASSSIASSTRRRCCSCGLRHCRRRRRIQCRGAQRGCWLWLAPRPPLPPPAPDTRWRRPHTQSVTPIRATLITSWVLEPLALT